MQRNYNVTGNERKRMVQIIGEVLGIHPEYMRMPTCAFRIGSITVSKTGVVDWEDDVVMEPVFATLTKEGFLAEEDPDLPTGLTISFPRDDSFTDQAVSNLQKMIALKAALIRKALAADQLTVNVTDDEISFPWWDTIPEDASVYTEFLSALVEEARNRTRVNAIEKPFESEKYAFRVFLLRLGFIGDEFKTARRILLKPLSGHSAFPTKAAADAFYARRKGKRADPAMEG